MICQKEAQMQFYKPKYFSTSVFSVQIEKFGEMALSFVEQVGLQLNSLIK